MFLQISKQAVTEEDAKAVLEASYRVRKPFDVSVMIVDPADYPQKYFLGFALPHIFLERKIRRELDATISLCSPDQLPETGCRKNLPIEDRGYFTDNLDDACQEIADTILFHQRHKDEYLASAYPLACPRISIAFYSRTTNNKEMEAAESLGIDADCLPPLPGFDAQHHFLSLWHEIAHSVAGDNEAGADLTSAMAYRYAFKDHSVLDFHGDLRAASMIMRHHNAYITHIYGWSCVEAFDSVAALKTPPSRDDVLDIGRKSYDCASLPRYDAIMAVGGALKQHCREAFQAHDLHSLSTATQTLLQNGIFSTPDEELIARRFMLAARRLSRGKPAYDIG